MFRVYVDDDLIGKSLTAVQAHILVGRALDRISLPRGGSATTHLRRPLNEAD
jgi:hypothetical protein